MNYELHELRILENNKVHEVTIQMIRVILSEFGTREALDGVSSAILGEPTNVGIWMKHAKLEDTELRDVIQRHIES